MRKRQTRGNTGTQSQCPRFVEDGSNGCRNGRSLSDRTTKILTLWGSVKTLFAGTKSLLRFNPFFPSWRGIRSYLLGTAAVIVAALAFLYLNHVHQNEKLQKLALDTGRDYIRSPFDMGDALRYCKLKTEMRYGDDLAMSYVDDHSTRHDLRSNLYKVFLIARVGDHRRYQEEAVHCFVDPDRRVLTHYRTIDLEQSSLMSRAMKFFE